MDLFPHFPLHLNQTIIFGLTLLLGLLGGELAKRIRFIPVILGYIAIGFIFGPGGLHIANAEVLSTARFFVEISLSLILFELGRHLDFRWLYRDRGLLPMAISESGFTFIIIFLIVYFLLGLSLLQSSLAATIAIATSPAVVMMIAYDLSAEGPVTRRSLILTSINNLIALILFTILLPMAQQKNLHISVQLIDSTYRLFGSIILGLCMFIIAEIIGYIIGKNKQNQFVLFVGMVTVTAGLSYICHVSSMLSLFTLGVAARNIDRAHILMEVDFDWLARIFFIILFVVTGVHIQLHGLLSIIGVAILLILARGFSKSVAIWLFAKKSNLTSRQVFSISLALTPMAGVAIGMSNILTDFNPTIGQPLLVIVTALVAILNIIGPIATQYAFMNTGEAISLKNMQGELQ